VLAPEPRPRRRGGERGHVIDLGEARRRRAKDPTPSQQARDVGARVAMLLERSQLVRARAVALCERADRVRHEAQLVRACARELPRVSDGHSAR
jgi:hypothetical protein